MVSLPRYKVAVVQISLVFVGVRKNENLRWRNGIMENKAEVRYKGTLGRPLCE